MIIFTRLLRFYLWQIPNDGQINRGRNRNSPSLRGRIIYSHEAIHFLFCLDCFGDSCESPCNDEKRRVDCHAEPLARLAMTKLSVCAKITLDSAPKLCYILALIKFPLYFRVKNQHKGQNYEKRYNQKRLFACGKSLFA